MVEDDVLKHLRALPDGEANATVESCRISTPLQQPWGKPCRLVEWTTARDTDARRQVIPADSTPLEIARVVAAHVPGRRILVDGEPAAPRRASTRRRTATA